MYFSKKIANVVILSLAMGLFTVWLVPASLASVGKLVLSVKSVKRLQIKTGTKVAKGDGWKLCVQMKKRTYFQAAADCYVREANAIKLSPSTKESLRVRKGYYMREAAKNLDKEAQKPGKSIKEAAYLREKAVLILEDVLKKKLVAIERGKRRGRITRNLASKLRKKIGYTPLAISTGNPKATVRIRGYFFKKEAKHQFNESVRPGPYTIIVRYPGAKPKKRKIRLQAGKSLVLNFLQNPGVPAISWIGYIVGGGLFAGGGTILTLGLLNYKTDLDCNENPSCEHPKEPGVKATNEDYMKASQQRVLVSSLVGGAMIVGGIALLAIAGVSHARATRKDFEQKEGTLPKKASLAGNTVFVWSLR